MNITPADFLPCSISEQVAGVLRPALRSMSDGVTAPPRSLRSVLAVPQYPSPAKSCNLNRVFRKVGRHSEKEIIRRIGELARRTHSFLPCLDYFHSCSAGQSLPNSCKFGTTGRSGFHREIEMTPSRARSESTAANPRCPVLNFQAKTLPGMRTTRTDHPVQFHDAGIAGRVFAIWHRFFEARQKDRRMLATTRISQEREIG